MTIQSFVFSTLLICMAGCTAAPNRSTGDARRTADLKMATTRTAADAKPIRIVLVGDSTVTDRVGWGEGFAELAGPGVTVINTASGGRSSKSFRDEGKWDAAVKQKGDYMLIQFGHNDQPGKGPERETDAKTTFKDNMVRYANEAKAAGFKPILVTSLVRRHFQPDGTIKSDLLDYAQATRAAAAEAQVPLIDLHDLSIPYFEKLGKAECERLAPTDARTGNVDTTHLSPPWHKPVAKLVVGALVKIEPELAGRFTLDR